MKIVVIGTRGIPDIMGGVETHCQELYPRLVAMGHDVTVIRRTPYVTDANKVPEYRGVHLVDVYAPRRKSIEAIVHTFLAVLRARRLRPDVLHVHAIGPWLMVPLARLLGMRVVATTHGPEYDRAKWGRMARAVLKTGEKFGSRWANEIIVISHTIADIMAERHGRTDTHLIYNGVNVPDKTSSEAYIRSLGLEPGRYIVAVGRFVPEKNFHLLVRAFRDSEYERRGYTLVIAGDADHADAYSEALKHEAAEADVVLTGFIKGEPLSEVMNGAALFVLPSSHEGLPISLLEAMAWRLPVLVSDIPANRLQELAPSDLFHLSGRDEADVAALRTALDVKCADAHGRVEYDLSPYNWDTIAAQTEVVYRAAIRKK